MKIHTQFVTDVNFRKITHFPLSYGPPVMKNEGVSMFKLIQDKLGINAFLFVFCPHAIT